MVLKVQEWLQTEAALSQKLRDEAYLDTVTGLANRSYFDVQLSALMHEEQKKFQGSLFLIQLSNFSDYNLQQGYESGDELLRQVASQLRIVTQDIPNSLLTEPTTVITFELPDAASPANLGMSNDMRVLALAMHSIVMTESTPGSRR